MKVLVTGALGHIGSALIRDLRFRQTFDTILWADNLETDRYCSTFNLPSDTSYKALLGDVQDTVSETVLENVDVVVHLAGQTDQVASMNDPRSMLDTNLRITQYLSDACAKTQTRLIFPSSTSVYVGRTGAISEDCSNLEPNTPYAKTKLLEERAILQGGVEAGFLILRLGTIFGVSPGMRFHTAVNRFCWQASMGLPVQVWSTAMNQMRPYLHLQDAIDAITHACTHGVFPNLVVDAVSENASVSQVLSIIQAHGLNVEVLLVDSPAMNASSFVVESDTASMLGFQFKGSLQLGIDEILRSIAAANSFRI